MANHFVQFASWLALRTEQECSQALAYHAELVKQAESLEPGEDGSLPEHPGSDFEAQLLVQDDRPGLWIYAEEAGDPAHVIDYVLRLARDLDLDGVWSFEWACTCDKMRIGAFTGGAAVLDFAKRAAHVLETQEWVHQTLMRLRDEQRS